MSQHFNFLTPEAEQAVQGDPDGYYGAPDRVFTSQAPDYAAQVPYETTEHQPNPYGPYSTSGFVPSQPAYSQAHSQDWAARSYPFQQPTHSPTTTYSTSPPPATSYRPYDDSHTLLGIPESIQPTSGSSRSVSPNPADLHDYGYPNNDGTWTCKYPGCSSKATFSRGCDLRKHFNRHTKSLFCGHKGCPQATEGGFSSKKDRARHEAKHNPEIVCEWDGCHRVFSRIDNMKDHVRRIHRRSIGS